MIGMFSFICMNLFSFIGMFTLINLVTAPTDSAAVKVAGGLLAAIALMGLRTAENRYHDRLRGNAE